MSKTLLNRFWRGLLYLLIGLTLAVGYLIWKIQAFKSEVFGFQPEAMALAQHTPKDVIGDLGGMKVRIPRQCAEYVEYNSDPAWGEKRKGPAPARTFDSKLSSFGIDARLPDMTCKTSQELREDYRKQFRNPERLWISIGINAGATYPTLGAVAPANHARLVIDTITQPTQYWFANYEALPDKAFGLQGYVVTGPHPKTGKPAKDTQDDQYFNFNAAGQADTYISCNKTEVLGGRETCDMRFSLEPKAKVYAKVVFVRFRLSQWQEIRQKTSDLLTSFELQPELSAQSAITNSSIH